MFIQYLLKKRNKIFHHGSLNKSINIIFMMMLFFVINRVSLMPFFFSLSIINIIVIVRIKKKKNEYH